MRWSGSLNYHSTYMSLRSNFALHLDTPLRCPLTKILYKFAFTPAPFPLNINILFFFFFYWRYNPLWVCILQPSSGAVASSRARFLDHTRRRDTVGSTPLDE